ncbi:MAG: hypothetical protein WDN46_08175 [Methylocella sp.]
MASSPTILSRVLIPAVPAFQGGAPLDLISLADIKLELKIASGADDVWLKDVITRQSRAVAKFCNRVFQVQTYQDQFWARREAHPWQIHGGFLPLQLAHWPIVARISPAGIAPPHAPFLSADAGGALAASIYYVRITYVTAEGETAPSLETRLVVGAGNLLQVAGPPLDKNALAIGWNVYASTTSFGEKLQNAAPMPIGEAWTLPATGLVTATQSPPNSVTVVENVHSPISPVSVPPRTFPSQSALHPESVAEGVGFLVDHTSGQLARLSFDGNVRQWPALPIIVQYQAGYVEIPDDLREAVIRLVKMRWFSRERDPLIRSENAAGVYEAQYFYGSGPGAAEDMPADIGAMLDRNYRVPVIA